ncbi:MAG: MBL fold metallo-hydrolase [Methanomicrobiaceae archaeon]|nr:MBL fold metallo-hydrolase [Methanomicrobiaceae archaeon]
MNRYSFVARMPDHPGALHRAADIIMEFRGNINRIHYDRRIDPRTVFFELTALKADYERILAELTEIGYLQTSLETLSFLKFLVSLPHRPGALDDFLTYTTQAGANISYIDFDEAGRHPDRVTVSLNVEESEAARDLLDRLKSRYPLEILEYDTTGEKLDNTVFYVRFAQKLRPLMESPDEPFLLSFLHNINHIVQELTGRGENPEQVFGNILATGETLTRTTGDGFYADVQQIPVAPGCTITCFQLPGGGSIFIIDTPADRVMVDTGYGIYYPDVDLMLREYGFGDREKISRLIITHADADHCGAGGLFGIPALMHPGTLEIIRQANRAYGSRSEKSVLEEVYTTMIGLFSRFTPPRTVELLPVEPQGTRGVFPILDTITIGNLEFEILESPGGHLYGQIFLYCHRRGILFAGDSLMNFASLTGERQKYNSLADFLVTSVNVDSGLARTERRGLLELAEEANKRLRAEGRSCLICGGHGAVSVLRDGRLEIAGEIEHYTRQKVL